jgi:Lrp/AsnC family transcriptional regulator
MSIHLDEIDRGILRILQDDSSISTAEIARQVGLSLSPCWRRIRRLEQVGIIRGKVALLDRHALGLEVTVFASVKLSEHGTLALPEFESAIEGLPEVIECYAMTGEVDYLLHVVTQDIRSYENFLRNRFWNTCVPERFAIFLFFECLFFSRSFCNLHTESISVCL